MMAAIVTMSLASNYIGNAQSPQAEATNPIDRPQPQGPDSGTPNQSSSDQEQDDTQRPTDWIAITGLLVSFGGVALVAATFYLQRIATVGDLRAYVRIDITKAHIGVGDPIAITVEPKNYGKTPAFRVTICSNIFIRNRTWSWEKDFRDPPIEEETEFLLHPNDGHHLVCRMRGENKEPIPLELGHLHAIANDIECLFARFLVEYRDTFGLKRTTEVRMEYSGPESVLHGVWRVSSVGNRAT